MDPDGASVNDVFSIITPADDNDAGNNATIIDPNNDGLLWDSHILLDDGEIISASESQLFRAYSGALGRTPDDEGYDWWLDQIEQGNHSLLTMAVGFIDSIEFRGGADTNGDGIITNDEFLNHMYRGVFKRAPDEGGYGFWIDQLDSNAKTQAVVLIDMTQSNEYVLQTVSAAVDYLVG